MNKKTLVVPVVLIVGIMLIIPVNAKGPVNAEEANPNAELLESIYSPMFNSLELNLPSEITNRWFGSGGVRVIVKPADKFYNPTDVLLDVADVPLWFTDYRATWVKMTKAAYLSLFVMFGLTQPTDVPDEGVYVWGGKTS